MEPTLINELRSLIESARSRAALAVNTELTMLYWHVGDLIDRELLSGVRGTYGNATVANLAEQLTREFGAGWRRRHLWTCVNFARAFPDSKIVHTLCAQLSWSHLRIISTLDDPIQREFYLELCRLDRWSVRQLQERIGSMLYERTMISRHPKQVLTQALDDARCVGEYSPELLLKDPYVLDFLGLKDRFLEKDLEDAVLREIEKFLLELGSGFSFVARQKRIQIDSDDFYIDLLLYNRKLRRLVVIDLKIGDFRPEYKGQMELYLRWLSKHEQESDEESPLGIILCTGKKHEQIELLELDKSGIHVAEYVTILPPRDVLQSKLLESLALARKRMSK